MDKTDKELDALRERIRAAAKAGNHGAVERLTTELEAADIRPAKVMRKPPAAWTFIAIPVATVAGILAIAGGIGAYLGKTAPPAPERVPVEAVVNCQSALRARLNYPATADFGWLGTQSKIDGGQYYVWQDFKAKNGFGVESEVRGLCIFPPGRATQNPEVIM